MASVSSAGSPEILLTFSKPGLRQSVRLYGRCDFVNTHTALLVKLTRHLLTY